MNSEISDVAFRELCDAAIDGYASAEQIRELENEVLSSPQRQRVYTEAVHLYAALCLSVSDAGESDAGVDVASTVALRPIERQPGERGGSRWKTVAAMTAAAATCAALLLFAVRTDDKVAKSFAALGPTESCSWQSSSVPIRTGQRIGACRLNLADGLATILFDNGARVDLEGPAEFQIVSSNRCLLHRGKLVATMESDLKGFVLETPHAVLIDQGTSFGVTVGADNFSEIEVFDGRVDVAHRHSGEERILVADEGVRFSQDEIQSLQRDGTYNGEASDPATNRLHLVQVSTANGDGRDCYIRRGQVPLSYSPPPNVLLVKLSKSGHNNFDRRAFLAFDLRKVDLRKLEKASVTLIGTPTRLGFSSRVPDSFFAVYGITDEILDDWSADTMQWGTSPAMDRDGSGVDDSTAVLLGRFKVRRGQQRGVFTIEGQALVDYLRNDRNRIATLVMVCETSPLQSGAYVHGFAGSGHKNLAPPTLRLWLEATGQL